jgi:hypothetical protein
MGHHELHRYDLTKLRIDAKDSDITWCQEPDDDQNANYEQLKSLVTQKEKEGVQNNLIDRNFDIDGAIQDIKKLSGDEEIKIKIKIHIPTGRYQRKTVRWEERMVTMCTGSQIAGGETHKLVYIGTFNGTLEVLLVKDSHCETFTLLQRYNFPNQQIRYIFCFDKKVLVSVGSDVVVLKQDFSEILGSGGKVDHQNEIPEEKNEIFCWPGIIKDERDQVRVSEDIKYLYVGDVGGQLKIWDISDPQNYDRTPIMQFTWDLKEDNKERKLFLGSDNKYSFVNVDHEELKLFHMAR